MRKIAHRQPDIGWRRAGGVNGRNDLPAFACWFYPGAPAARATQVVVVSFTAGLLITGVPRR
jgi:hypothetical protein